MTPNEKIWITEVGKIYPLENMNVSTNYNGNASNICPDISLKTKIINF